MDHEEEDYGKLEFLGDAVLGLVVTQYLFFRLGADSHKKLQPGLLSELRSSIVNNDTLAFVACVRGLDKCLLHSSPHLYHTIDTFRSVRCPPLPSNRGVLPLHCFPAQASDGALLSRRWSQQRWP